MADNMENPLGEDKYSKKLKPELSADQVPCQRVSSCPQNLTYEKLS